jgi:hypothetical protein
VEDGLALTLEPGLELVGKNLDRFTGGTEVGPRVIIYDIDDDIAE